MPFQMAANSGEIFFWKMRSGKDADYQNVISWCCNLFRKVILRLILTIFRYSDYAGAFAAISKGFPY